MTSSSVASSAAATVDFHTQIASIMEVLANAAVAEICKVVDDGYAEVSLEVANQSSKENAFLRRKIRLLELQMARYRAERCANKSTAGGGTLGTGGGPPGGGFQFHHLGVRVASRAHTEALAAGPSLQGRTRFLNRGPGVNQPVSKIKPVNLDQDPDQDVVTTTKTESADAEIDGENQLLIVKVEGAAESRAPTGQETTFTTGSRIGTGAGGGGEDDVIASPPGRPDDRADGNASSGHPGETEVSGSDVISFVVVPSETDRTTTPSDAARSSREPELTGSDVRAACKTEPAAAGGEDGRVGGEEEEGGHWGVAAGDTALPRACTGVTASADDVAMETELSHADQQQQPPAPGSSVLEVIVIDGEAAPGEDGGAGLRWCDAAGQSTTDHARLGDAMLTSPQNKQPAWTAEPAGKGGSSWFYPPGNAPAGTFTGSVTTSSHAITGDTLLRSSGRRNINAAPPPAGQFKHSERTVRVQHHPVSGGGGAPAAYTSHPPVNHLSQRPPAPPNAGPHQTYQKPSAQQQQQHPGQRHPGGPQQQQTHVSAVSSSMYRPYSCTSCSKCFFVQADLQRHMARHTKEKPFVCSACGKTFVCQSQLQMHVNVHTGARPFGCATCGRRFSHPSNLRRHQKIQH